MHIFEWDDAKVESNQRKHGVAFLIAMTVFDDPFSIGFIDPLSGEYGEERFVIVGMGGTELLAVTYTDRGESVRLISARRATRKEHDDYYRENSRR